MNAPGRRRRGFCWRPPISLLDAPTATLAIQAKRWRRPSRIRFFYQLGADAGALTALEKVPVGTMTTAAVLDHHAMWATRKNAPDLTCEQRTSLAQLADTDRTRYPAYLLKEQLREVFRVKGQTGRQLLAGWPLWALHSRIPESVALAATSAASTS